MSDDFGDWRLRRTPIPPDDAVLPMAQAVVAPGRTVEARGAETELVGYDANGAPVYRLKRRLFVAGETVTVPATDLPWLVAQGYVLPAVPA